MEAPELSCKTLLAHTGQVSHYTRIQHWQLRDLVKSSTVDGQTFLWTVSSRDNTDGARVDYINRYGPYGQPGAASEVYYELSWPPTTIDVYDGRYLAVGGHMGIVDIYDITLADRNPIHHIGDVGNQTVNNLAFIRHKSGKLCLFTCSNDKSVRLFTIDESGVELVVRKTHRVPANYITGSPDGEHVLVVGDSEDATMYKISTACDGLRKVRQFSFKSGAPAGRNDGVSMAAAFSSDGMMLACGTQSGVTVVFSTRDVLASSTPTPLATIASSQHNSHGAVRTIKFCPRGDYDLLIIGEHDRAVDIVDTRPFRELARGHDAEINTVIRRQIVPVEKDNHGAICGVCWLKGGETAVVAQERRLFFADINIPARHSTSVTELA